MKKFVVLAGTIPVYNDKVLLVQRSLKSKFLPGNWGLPCGKIDFGEDLETAALRELNEETGLDGEILKIVGSSKFVGNKEGTDLHNIQINHLIKVFSDKVIINEESEAYKWIKIDEFEDSEIDEFNKQVLRQAFPKNYES